MARRLAAVNSGGKGNVPEQDEPTSNYIQTWGRLLVDDQTKHQVNLCTSRYFQIPESTKPPLWSGPLKRLPNGQLGWSPMSDPAFTPQHLNLTSYRSDPYQEAPQENPATDYLPLSLTDTDPSDSTAGLFGAMDLSPSDRLRDRQPQPRGTSSVSTPLCFDTPFHGHGYLVTDTVDPLASPFFDTSQGPPILDPLASFISYQGSEPVHFASPKMQPRTPTAAHLTQNAPFTDPTREQHMASPNSHSFLLSDLASEHHGYSATVFRTPQEPNCGDPMTIFSNQMPIYSASADQGTAAPCPIAPNWSVEGDQDPSRHWCPFCRTASFCKKNTLNRHIKDKHLAQGVCRFCGAFRWPQGRKYLFKAHLRSHCKMAKLFKRNDCNDEVPGTLNHDESQGPLASCMVSSHTITYHHTATTYDS